MAHLRLACTQTHTLHCFVETMPPHGDMVALRLLRVLYGFTPISLNSGIYLEALSHIRDLTMI